MTFIVVAGLRTVKHKLHLNDIPVTEISPIVSLSITEAHISVMVFFLKQSHEAIIVITQQKLKLADVGLKIVTTSGAKAGLFDISNSACKAQLYVINLSCAFSFVCRYNSNFTLCIYFSSAVI